MGAKDFLGGEPIGEPGRIAADVERKSKAQLAFEAGYEAALQDVALCKGVVCYPEERAKALKEAFAKFVSERRGCSCGGNPHTTTCPMKPQGPQYETQTTKNV